MNPNGFFLNSLIEQIQSLFDSIRSKYYNQNIISPLD